MSEIIDEMLYDIDICASENRDYYVAMITALTELQRRQSMTLDQVTQLKELSDGYGYMMRQIFDFSGILSSFLNAQSWNTIEDTQYMIREVIEKLETD